MRAQTFLHIHGLIGLPELEAAIAVARLSRRELLSTPNIGRGAADAIGAWLEPAGSRHPAGSKHRNKGMSPTSIIGITQAIADRFTLVHDHELFDLIEALDELLEDILFLSLIYDYDANVVDVAINADKIIDRTVACLTELREARS
jgi:hypothetical protein